MFCGFSRRSPRGSFRVRSDNPKEAYRVLPKEKGCENKKTARLIIVLKMDLNIDSKITTGCLLFTLAHILGFFQVNLRYIYKWSQNKDIYFVLLLSMPIGFLYYKGWGLIMESSQGSAWTSRFMSFGVSYLVFPLLAYFCLGESALTLKTLVCVFLSFLIIYVQIVL